MRFPVLFFVVLFGSLPLMGTTCETASTTPSRSCDVRLSIPTPTEGLPGEEILIAATPLTTIQDSSLFVGGLQATIVGLDRAGCEACDTCRLEADCNPCEDCDSCDAQCETECSESLRFEVPALDAGPTQINLYNLFGNSDGQTFTVLEADEPPDTGSESSSDTGLTQN
jgi:hypothetical protein